MNSQDIFEEASAGLTALSHPARLAILCHLSSQPSCCCREVVAQFDLAQSTVSQHLKVLVDAGLVRFEAKGARSRYEVDRDALASLRCRIDNLLDRIGGAN